MNLLKKIFKDKRVIFGTILVIAVVFLALIINVISNEKYEFVGATDGEEIKKEYETLNNQVVERDKKYPKVELPLNNNLKYSSISEVISIFENKGDAVIYFGTPTCLYCRSSIQVLCDTAASTELDVIYYLDVDNTDKDYGKLLSTLGEKFTIDNKGEELYIPLVIFVTDGRVVSYHKGTVSSHLNYYDELDKDQKEGLTFIYKSGINDVLDSIKIKKESVK